MGDFLAEIFGEFPCKCASTRNAGKDGAAALRPPSDGLGGNVSDAAEQRALGIPAQIAQGEGQRGSRQHGEDY